MLNLKNMADLRHGRVDGGGTERKEYDFRREHKQLYEAINETWPPPPSTFEKDRYRYLQSSGERVKELAVLVDKLFRGGSQRLNFPYTIEFADLRDGPQRLLNWKIDTTVEGLRNPWTLQPKTITSKSRLIMRVDYFGGQEDSHLVRRTPHLRLMYAQGHPYRVYLCVCVCVSFTWRDIVV